MSARTLGLSDSVHQYLVDLVDEPAALSRLRAETEPLPMARMQISPEQGQFMAWLATTLGAQNAIEVGVFTGYSAIAVARALPEDGLLVACDINEEWTAMARRAWADAGVEDKIELRLAPATETLQQMLDLDEAGSYDLMFIDADKTGYDDYYELGLQLLRVGGVIAIDNALWGGRVADTKVEDDDTKAIRAINEKVTSDPRVSASLIPLGDGVLLATKL